MSLGKIRQDTCVHYTFLNPAHALHGGVSYFAFVCLSVCLCVR